ncbi:acyl-CoA dehydrogenase family protein [Paenibacillus xylaniclasticus]|uniref:acyl-CoA dehydrogenase family protein n=1 Tax=Paenibacillus xylaniclasticus TaxID=588083 RepID=UPI000FD962A1|nr:MULTISPECIES: acyl-CoA dehydrogenase family protein [Paenibacillus]GFN31427.1 FMNH2-dependent monooxygenase [Paenibacillus curdlanolyticus]
MSQQQQLEHVGQPLLERYAGVVDELVKQLAETAVERDRTGGTAVKEKELLRASGLLHLLIPEEYGGLGGTWSDVLYITRRIARVDSSIAHLFAYHFVNLVTPHMFGSAEQKAFYYRETISRNLFWGNAFNPVELKVFATKQGEHYVVNGTKGFCSGATDSDYLILSALRSEDSSSFIAIVPTRREGIYVHNDWDNFGQRQTDSGQVTFTNVIVKEAEVLHAVKRSNSEFIRLREYLALLVLGQVYLGIAEGAFEAAKSYTRTTTRAYRKSGVAKASEDPYILKHYGEMWVELSSARLLADQAAARFDQAWEHEADLHGDQFESTIEAIILANAAATKVGVGLTSRIFEVMGARSTSSQYGFDRYWRNIRTHTLHDPLDYKLKELGKWALLDSFQVGDSLLIKQEDKTP